MENKIPDWKIIYDYYAEGNSLTVWSCRDIFNNPNLRSRNSDIERKMNIKLGRIWETSETGKTYYRFFLEEFRYKFEKPAEETKPNDEIKPIEEIKQSEKVIQCELSYQL